MTPNPNVQTAHADTQTDADRGRAIVAYHAERRAMLAERARDNRALPYRVADMMASATPGARAAIVAAARDAARRNLAVAPRRLASRADILRYANDLTAWATGRSADADWQSMPCGEDDALAERIDAARQDARYLRAYADTLA